MNLNDTDKNRIIELVKAGEKLPKEFIYKLFSDEEDVFLFWNGRKEDTTNMALPFHCIEHIDEPRKEKDKAQASMFETDFRGRQLKGWTNKLIWGDNKLILSSLVNGPIREEIEKEGGLKLIYIDPPFAVGADFGFNIEIGGETAEKKQSWIIRSMLTPPNRILVSNCGAEFNMTFRQILTPLSKCGFRSILTPFGEKCWRYSGAC